MSESKFEFTGVKLLGTIKKMQLDPQIVKTLEDEMARYDAILKAGERERTIPKYNYGGECPNCGSKLYFKLYGGARDKSCAQCQTGYDGLTDQEWVAQNFKRA